MQPFNVVIAGIRRSASWRLDGDDVCVTSAYGSKRTPLGLGDPQHAAEQLFREIVAEKKRALGG